MAQNGHLGHRIDALRHRIHQKPGQNNALRDQLQNLRARRYFKQQRNTPLPFSAQYNTTVAQARNERNQTVDSLAGQRLAQQQQYGIGPNGEIQAGDPNFNPYSEARQLEASYAAKRGGILNSAAASGQLYSGATQNAFGYARNAYGTAQDDLLRRYQADQGKLTQGELDARQKFQTAKQQAGATWLQDAVNATPDPTEASRPKFANQFLHGLNQRANRLDQQGRQRRAAALRQRVARLS